MRERSIGLGAMGFHAYLQRHNIPFESFPWQKIEIWQCSGILNLVQKLQAKNLLKSAEKLLMQSVLGRRNVHFLAVAPNASSLSSVVIQVLVLSHIVLTHILRKLKAAPAYKKMSIYKLYSKK